MTLVLTCVTHDYVVQVSDRRLTVDGSVQECPANKAVLYCSSVAFAYTGLAKIGKQPTDEWLMGHLAEQRPGSVADLADAATRAFRMMHFPGLSPEKRRRLRCHAFVAAGFGQAGPSANDELHPFSAIVSNFYLPPNRWLAESEVRFSSHPRFLSREATFDLSSAGQVLKNEEASELRRSITRCVNHTTSPWPAARYLARQVRAVAKRNPLVGRNVMCVVVPRPRNPKIMSTRGSTIPLIGQAINDSELFRGPSAEDDEREFETYWVYWPGDSQAFPYYGPNIVCGGWQVKGQRFARADRPLDEVSERIDTGPLEQQRMLP